MKIVTTPNPILNTTTKTVSSIDKKIKKLVVNMKATLEKQSDPKGVGLAAPQVGYGLRLFIMKPTEKSKLTVCINPEIISSVELGVTNSKNKKIGPPTPDKRQKQTKLEGCLSIPKIWGHVKRPNKILLRFLDIAGLSHEKWFSGFEAIIVQHEMDHLEGILFTRRVLEQTGKLYREEAEELKEYVI